jgi:hypothetical protein
LSISTYKNSRRINFAPELGERKTVPRRFCFVSRSQGVALSACRMSSRDAGRLPSVGAEVRGHDQMRPPGTHQMAR